MVKRLAYLDEVDLMRGAEGEADTNHIRYGLINRKGAKMMIYFQRIMLPAITKPVMLHVVDPRLMYSWYTRGSSSPSPKAAASQM